MHTLNFIREFLQTWGLDILLWTIVLFAGVFVWKKGKQRTILRLAREAVVFMEEKWNNPGTGELKKIEAINYLYTRLPKTFKLIFSEKALDKITQDAFEWMINFLDKQAEKYPENKLILGSK